MMRSYYTSGSYDICDTCGEEYDEFTPCACESDEIEDSDELFSD